MNLRFLAVKQQQQQQQELGSDNILLLQYDFRNRYKDSQDILSNCIEKFQSIAGHDDDAKNEGLSRIHSFVLEPGQLIYGSKYTMVVKDLHLSSFYVFISLKLESSNVIYVSEYVLGIFHQICNILSSESEKGTCRVDSLMGIVEGISLGCQSKGRQVHNRQCDASTINRILDKSKNIYPKLKPDIISSSREEEDVNDGEVAKENNQGCDDNGVKLMELSMDGFEYRRPVAPAPPAQRALEEIFCDGELSKIDSMNFNSVPSSPPPLPAESSSSSCGHNNTAVIDEERREAWANQMETPGLGLPPRLMSICPVITEDLFVVFDCRNQVKSMWIEGNSHLTGVTDSADPETGSLDLEVNLHDARSNIEKYSLFKELRQHAEEACKFSLVVPTSSLSQGEKKQQPIPLIQYRVKDSVGAPVPLRFQSKAQVERGQVLTVAVKLMTNPALGHALDNVSVTVRLVDIPGLSGSLESSNCASSWESPTARLRWNLDADEALVPGQSRVFTASIPLTAPAPDLTIPPFIPTLVRAQLSHGEEEADWTGVGVSVSAAPSLENDKMYRFDLQEMKRTYRVTARSE